MNNNETHQQAQQEIKQTGTVKWFNPAKGFGFIVSSGGGEDLFAHYSQIMMEGYKVLYKRLPGFLREFSVARADGSYGKLIRSCIKSDLLIIDDMGLKQLPRNSGEHLFEIVMRRYENRSTIMTSNRPIEEWGKLVADVPSATAILDRMLHHAEIINITGKSYRLKDRVSRKDSLDKKAKE